jgi:diguanylate cyclase (GGDEF)-like protein
MDIHGVIEAVEGVIIVALLLYGTKLYDLAYKDQLTGLWTSRYFFRKGNALLKKANENDLVCTVFFADVDNLKTLNDKNSHAVGDRAIKTVAETISSLFGKDSLVARRSGDEFIVLYVSENKSMANTAELSLRTNLGGLFVNNGKDQKVFLSATIGAFEIQPGKSLASSIDEADRAMLRNKKRRNEDAKKAG